MGYSSVYHLHMLSGPWQASRPDPPLIKFSTLWEQLESHLKEKMIVK